MPKISVIIPVYTAINRIDELLGSILFQSEEDVEIICAVAPESPCLRVIERYTIFDKRVKFLISPTKSKGLVEALKYVSSPYVLFLRPNSFANTPYLKTLLQIVATSEKIDFVYAPISYRDEITQDFYHVSALNMNDLSTNQLLGCVTTDQITFNLLQI